MPSSALVLARNSSLPLSIPHIEKMEVLLEQGCVLFNPPFWLRKHVAAEFSLTQSLPLPFFDILREEFAADGCDVFCVPENNRRKKLLLADMDATIVEGEALDDLAAFAGLKDEIAAITARAMRGDLDFHQALKERVFKLKGLPRTALAQTLSNMRINEGAETLVRVMTAFGAHCVLVSGGFTFFTEAIAKACGFHAHHGNVLKFDGEVLSGEVAPPILDKNSKLDFLNRYIADCKIDEQDTLAVGDGANDIPMLVNAGIGVGFRPKLAVRDAVLNRIVHTDLTSLLYIQGYTAEEIDSVSR